MAGTIVYNDSPQNCKYIFRATSGGTVFSANLAGTTTHDLFTDTAVVDDAIYFSSAQTTGSTNQFASLFINVGTALVADAITLKWEYYHYGKAAWVDIPNLTDNTTSFTTTGLNEVEFPNPPYWYVLTVNSVAHMWVRVRISAVTNITEGGAITTNAVQAGDGLTDISGYTSGSPLTSEDLYDWMLANTPVPVVKIADYYEFPTTLICASDNVWESQNEIILLGNGSGIQACSMGNFIAGEKIGNYGAANGSTILVCHRTGGASISMPFAELYGSVLKRGYYYDRDQDFDYSSSVANRQSIYTMEMQASIIDNPGYIDALSQTARCIFYGNMPMSNHKPDTDKEEGAVFMSSSGYIFYIYDDNLTFRDIYWDNPGGYICLCHSSFPDRTQTLTMINPTPAVPEADASSAPYAAYIPGNTAFEVHERYTFDLIVIDSNGDPISGATVTLSINGANDAYELVGATFDEIVDADETSIITTDGSAFEVGDILRVNNEVMTVTNKVGDYTIEVSRTRARTYQSGQTIYRRVTGFTTDANGQIEQQNVIYKRYYYDADSTNYGKMEQEVSSQYTVTISKSGYKTRTIIYTMDQKRVEVEKLDVQVPIFNVVGNDVKQVVNANPVDGQNSLVLDVLG